jgi:hypothetical protein
MKILIVASMLVVAGCEVQEPQVAPVNGYYQQLHAERSNRIQEFVQRVAGGLDVLSDTSLQLSKSLNRPESGSASGSGFALFTDTDEIEGTLTTSAGDRPARENFEYTADVTRAIGIRDEDANVTLVVRGSLEQVESSETIVDAFVLLKIKTRNGEHEFKIIFQSEELHSETSYFYHARLEGAVAVDLAELCAFNSRLEEVRTPNGTIETVVCSQGKVVVRWGEDGLYVGATGAQLVLGDYSVHFLKFDYFSNPQAAAGQDPLALNAELKKLDQNVGRVQARSWFDPEMGRNRFQLSVEYSEE